MASATTTELDPPPCREVAHPPPTHVLYRGRDRLCGVPGEFALARCPLCGLAGTSPRLDERAMAAYYLPSYPAHRTPPQPRGWRGRLGARVDAARFSLTVRMGAFAPLLRRAPGSLLDVGCGRGELASWFAGRGWRAFGVEPGEEAAEHAAATGVETHHGTLEDAPFEAGSFDAILFNHSLEHIPEPEAALRQACALLAPDGLLVISVPNFGCWQRRVFGSRWFHLDLPRHLQHFDRDSLSAMLTRNGFEIASVRTSSSMAGIVGSVQYALWGRSRLSDATMFRLMHLSYPLIALGDLLADGDCLHVSAAPSPA